MKKPLVIHPLLFAIFPFLFFYAYNIEEIQSLTAVQIFLVAGAALGLVSILWLIFGLLLKDMRKAGLAASIMVFLLLTYGHFYSLLEQWDVFVPGHGHLIPGVLLAFGYFVYFIRRARCSFATITHVLNVAAAVLIAMNAFTIVSHEISSEQMANPETANTGPSVPVVLDDMPDIYFIVLDEYAHPDTIKQYYGYDNEPFVRSLEERGFFVARGSTMRNEKSVRAIASILNMEPTPETEARHITHQRITDNRVVDCLESAGYRYIYFGQWYELKRYEIEADEYINYYKDMENGLLTAEIAAVFLDATILKPFSDSIAGEYYEGYYREGFTRTLEHLGEMPEVEGPKFVYAHLMAPHAPFVFGPNGERVAPENYYNFDDQQFYLGQYVYTNRQISKVIDDLLGKSASDPIIVIQSDHGPRWLLEWPKILNAYHLPGDGKELLYDSISPVDTFRIILNHYFDAGLEPSEGSEKYLETKDDG